MNDRDQHPSGMSVEAKDESEKARPPGRRLRRWAFALVPLVGLLELAVHLVQVNGGVDASDWRAARDLVKTLARPQDLVLVAPRWADPLGREYLGSDVLTVEREARSDETGFPRAIQVSLGRERPPELRGWRLSAEQRVGRLLVTTLENPAPVQILDRLLDHQGPEHMRVSQVSRGQETECPFTRGAAQAGSLGFGPAVPAQLFTCPGGGFVGVSIIATLDYTPRRCFYAPVTAGGTGLRVHFKDVVFGRMLHGHHALYVEAERNRAGAAITLDVSVDGQALGHLIHHDGEGWKAFDVATDALLGQRKDLVFDIKSGDGSRRMYCFEADTR